MTSLLQSKGLFKFVTPRAAILKEQAQDDWEKLETLTEGDERALGLIRCHIEPAFLEVVLEATNANDAWKLLDDFFAGKETFNKIHLLEQLIDGKLYETNNPTKDVQDFLKSKNDIIRRLGAAGIPISEDLQVAIMLARLPESYETMRRILEAQPNLTVLKVTSELTREAIRRGSKRQHPERSFFANDSNRALGLKKVRNEKSFCNFCSVKGHDTQRCWLNPKSTSYRPDFRQKLLQGLKNIDNLQQ